MYEAITSDKQVAPVKQHHCERALTPYWSHVWCDRKLIVQSDLFSVLRCGPDGKLFKHCRCDKSIGNGNLSNKYIRSGPYRRGGTVATSVKCCGFWLIYWRQFTYDNGMLTCATFYNAGCWFHPKVIQLEMILFVYWVIDGWVVKRSIARDIDHDRAHPDHDLTGGWKITQFFENVPSKCVIVYSSCFNQAKLRTQNDKTNTKKI